MPTSGLATTTAAGGLGGAVAIIIHAHFPSVGPSEIGAWGVVVTSVVGFIAHSGWGSKLFPKSATKPQA